MSHFSGHFEGASTFLTPKLSLAGILPPKKNYIPQFLKQRDINSYYSPRSESLGLKDLVSRVY
jgi:hypothetical protein